MSHRSRLNALRSGITRGLNNFSDFGNGRSSFPQEYKALRKADQNAYIIVKKSGERKIVNTPKPNFTAVVTTRPGTPDMNAVQTGYIGRQNRKYR